MKEEKGPVLAWQVQFDIKPNELEMHLLTQKQFNTLGILFDENRKPSLTINVFGDEYKMPAASEVNTTATLWCPETETELGTQINYVGQKHPKVADLPRIVAVVYFQLVAGLPKPIEEAMRNAKIARWEIISGTENELPKFEILFQDVEYIIPVKRELFKKIILLDPSTNRTIELHTSEKPLKVTQLAIPQVEMF